ncbi:MAG: 16S rRNA processing protein RimM [Bacteroidetes bacterium]|nr:MAG: 16S rRNA processing protein RimM [Bacteroidota bacterium]
MAYVNNILLGLITKVSGYEGAVTVRLEKIFYENIPRMESVFLEIEGKQVPFFISDSEYSGASLLKIKFEGYNSIKQVSEFIGCKVFLTTSVPAEKEKGDIQIFNGYQVFNYDNKLLGEFKEIITNPGQLLLSITSTNNKEILVPFHEHFILSIDKRRKRIVMNIPEGLTEIN